MITDCGADTRKRRRLGMKFESQRQQATIMSYMRPETTVEEMIESIDLYRENCRKQLMREFDFKSAL